MLKGLLHWLLAFRGAGEKSGAFLILDLLYVFNLWEFVGSFLYFQGSEMLQWHALLWVFVVACIMQGISELSQSISSYHLFRESSWLFLQKYPTLILLYSLFLELLFIRVLGLLNSNLFLSSSIFHFFIFDWLSGRLFQMYLLNFLPKISI